MKQLLLTIAFALTGADRAEPVRVVITLPADFPARIRRVAPELSVQAFVRAATEAELTGLEGTLHVGAKR